jgi:hypothetical protein
VVYIASHVLGLAVLLLLFQTTGSLVARLTPALDSANRTTGVVRIGVGIGVWIYLLFALAVLQLLRPPILLGLMVVVLTGGAALFRGARWRREDDGGLPLDHRWPWLGHAIAWLPLAAVLTVVFVRGLTPLIGWDDNVAHLTLPKIYLEHGGFRRLPFNVYSNWPLNVELLYALAMALQDYVLAKLVNVAFLGLLTAAVYRFAARAAAPWAGLVAAVLLLANDVVLVEAPSANVDIAVAFFFFVAATLAVEFRERGDRRALVVSGIFCGLVAGSKITGLAAVLCILPLIVAGTLATSPTRRLQVVTRNAVLFAAPALALALPWLVRSFVYTGDPMYPGLWKWLGGVEWSDAINEDFLRWQRSIGMGRSFMDYLLLPVRVILQGGHDYRHFGASISKSWIFFVPLAAISAPVVPAVRRCLLPAALYFVVWSLTSQQTRLLIAVLPLLAASAAIGLSWWVSRIGEKTGRREFANGRISRYWLAMGGVAGCLAFLNLATRHAMPMGFHLIADLRAHPPELTTWVPNPMYTFIRNHTDPSARLMLLNTNHGFFIHRDYIADSFFEASQLNAQIVQAGDRDGLTPLFQRLGITHVLVDRTAYVPFPQALWNYLADPTRAAARYTSPDGALTLYQLKVPRRG